MTPIERIEQRENGMIEYFLCHRVALNLSYYNAAEGDCWRNEAKSRNEASRAWMDCRRWLYEQGTLEEFLTKGQYLLPPKHYEIKAARIEIEEEKKMGTPKSPRPTHTIGEQND